VGGRERRLAGLPIGLLGGWLTAAVGASFATTSARDHRGGRGGGDAVVDVVVRRGPPAPQRSGRTALAS
jgi:hypothetical protein